MVGGLFQLGGEHLDPAGFVGRHAAQHLATDVPAVRQCHLKHLGDHLGVVFAVPLEESHEIGGRIFQRVGDGESVSRHHDTEEVAVADVEGQVHAHEGRKPTLVVVDEHVLFGELEMAGKDPGPILELVDQLEEGGASVPGQGGGVSVPDALQSQPSQVGDPQVPRLQTLSFPRVRRATFGRGIRAQPARRRRDLINVVVLASREWDDG